MDDRKELSNRASLRLDTLSSEVLDVSPDIVDHGHSSRYRSSGEMMEEAASLVDSGCSSVEQDHAPLEKLLGDSIMSPISIRRDSFEVWSCAKPLVAQEEEEQLELRDVMAAEQAKSYDDVEEVQDAEIEACVATTPQQRSASLEERYDLARSLSNDEQQEDEYVADLSQRMSRALNESTESNDEQQEDQHVADLSQRMSRALKESTESNDEQQEDQHVVNLSQRMSRTLNESTESNDEQQEDQHIVNLSQRMSRTLNESTESNDDQQADQPVADLSQRSISRSLNESTGSAYSVDYISTKQKIDASSHAFMEQLRGAANRRKLQVIRSRDSLVAKQKGLKETTIAAVAALEEAAEPGIKPTHKRQATKHFKPFKALPMPSASGSGKGVPLIDKKPQTTPFSPMLGARRQQKVVLPSKYGSGQVGVPMVEKKPQTTPFSPLLGARRQQKVVLPSNYGSGQVGVPMVDKKPQTTPFSPLLGARRQQKVVLPSNYGSGQVGVPMVDKKPQTTPFSPLLGARRQQKVVVKALQYPSTMVRILEKPAVPKTNAPQTLEPKFKARPLPPGFSRSGAGQMGTPKTSKRPATVARSPRLGFRRQDVSTATSHTSVRISKSDSSISSLVGLQLLSPAPRDNLENLPPAHVNTPKNCKTTEYMPHSTIRAKGRAQYDRQRSVNEAKRLEETKRGWKREIKLKRAEIAKLRETL